MYRNVCSHYSVTFASMSHDGQQQFHNVLEAAHSDIDEDDGYADSALGLEENVAGYVNNLHYTYINGRQFQPTAYIPPVDQKEIDRMNLKHHLCNLLFEGRLHFAPIDDHPQNILDLGTGSGKWAMDIADQYPMAHVEATDLNPIQPTVVPPNLEFIINHDFNSEWNLKEGIYYLVHSRFNHLYVTSWPTFLSQAFRVLRRGGYFEMHEKLYGWYSDDGTFPSNSNLAHWYRQCKAVLEQTDRASNLSATEIVRMMQEIGFEDIMVRPYKVPINGWPKDPLMKEIGRVQQAQSLLVIEHGTKIMLKPTLGWSDEQCTKVARLVTRDMKNRSFHIYQKMYVIYGRKP